MASDRQSTTKSKGLLAAQNEITFLRQSLVELHERTTKAEHNLHAMKKYQEATERENRALKKSIAKFHGLFKDLERTMINGLWHAGLRDERFIEILAGLQEKNYIPQNTTSVPQEKLSRLNNGADQQFQFKDFVRRQRSRERVDTGRERAGTGSGSSHALVRLDQELWSRLGELQTQALTLLDESNLICTGLLEDIKHDVCIRGEESERGQLGSEKMKLSEEVVDEFGRMVYMLKRRADSLRNSIYTVKEILKEKSILTCNEALRQDRVTELENQLRLKEERISTLEAELQKWAKQANVFGEELANVSNEMDI